MNPSRPLLACALLLAACASPRTRDLATNPDLYLATAFRTAAPGDRTVFVTPLSDSRDRAAMPAAAGGFPIQYDSEGRWARPALSMLGEVLGKEVGGSGLFAALLPGAQPDAVVLKPSLVAFHSGVMEVMEGARSHADVALRVQVYGPAAADGERPLWLDEVFGERQQSGTSMTPVSTLLLTGRALRATMMKLLTTLDGSNVGRSGVPMEAIPPPAPATPPR